MKINDIESELKFPEDPDELRRYQAGLPEWARDQLEQHPPRTVRPAREILPRGRRTRCAHHERR